MFSEYMLIALFYVSGVLVSSKISMSAVLFAVLAAIMVFLVRLLFLKKTETIILAAALCFFIGGIRYYGATENRLYYELPDKYVTLSGTVVSMPSETNGKYRYRYTVKSDSFTYLGSKYITRQSVLVKTDQKFAYGDIIRASGFLSTIEVPDNSNEYDYSKYYKSRGVYNRINAREIEKTGEQFSLNPIFLIGKFKYLVSCLLDEHFSGNRAAIYKAIAVGDKTGFSNEYTTLLVKTGISRVLYSSFLHITFIYFIVGLCIRSKSKDKRNFMIMLLLIVYALFNSTTAIILKAAALLGILIFRKEVSGFADKMDILSLILFVMTLIDPMLCYNGSFVLSIASTVVVYTSYSIVLEKVTIYFSTNIYSRIKTIVAMWITLLLGTLPLCAYFYNGIEIYGIIFIHILMPVMLVLLIISPLALGMYAIFGIAPVLGVATNLILGLIEKIPYFIERLPFYHLTLKTPTILEIVIFYVMWWIFLRIISGRRNTQKTKVLAAVLCGLVIGNVNSYSFNSLSVYFVNVGQGDGAVLKTSAGEVVLIDGGGAPDYQEEYNIGEMVYVPYLISYGLTDIDVAIVSHYHKDHVEGIIAAAKQCRINTIVMPGSSPSNEYRLQLEKIAEERNIKIEYLKKNDIINFKSGLKIEFLAPDSKQLSSEELNDTSLVAKVSFGSFSALFTGDSTDEIDESYPRNIDILKVAHHGSDTSNSQEYIDWISPRYAIIGVGKDNSYGLPDDEVVMRLKKTGAKVLRTDENGDIQFKVKKNGDITYKTLKGG